MLAWICVKQMETQKAMWKKSAVAGFIVLVLIFSGTLQYQILQHCRFHRTNISAG